MLVNIQKAEWPTNIPEVRVENDSSAVIRWRSGWVVDGWWMRARAATAHCGAGWARVHGRPGPRAQMFSAAENLAYCGQNSSKKHAKLQAFLDWL